MRYLQNIITVFLLVILAIADSQAKVIGEGRYVFTYDVTVKPEKDLDYYEHNTYYLQIGENVSKFYSKRFERKRIVTDSILSHHGKQQDQFAIFSKENLWEVKPNYVIFKKIDKSPHIVWTEYMGSHYMAKDNLPNISWNTIPGDSVICGQPCKQAIGEFRGIKWIIWFATEIPIDNGPWKLGGAPGLILDARDSNGYFTFECVGIQEQKEDIIFHDEWQYEEMKPKKLSSLIKKWKTNQAGMVEALSGANLPIEVRESLNRKKRLTEIEIFE